MFESVIYLIIAVISLNNVDYYVVADFDQKVELSVTAINAWFTAMRMVPLLAWKPLFQFLRAIPILQQRRFQISFIMKSYSRLGESTFAKFDKKAHEHCITYISNAVFN